MIAGTATLRLPSGRLIHKPPPWKKRCASPIPVTLNEHKHDDSDNDHDQRFDIDELHHKSPDSDTNMCQMTSKHSDKGSLLDTIAQSKFYQLDETILLHQIKEAFPFELSRLKCVVAAEKGSPMVLARDSAKRQLSPSEELYGQNYDEINRTLVGVLALRWIWNDEYKHFTTNQTEHLRLRRDSWEWLRKLFTKNVRTNDDLLLLVVSMVINDVGKDPNLADDYYDQTKHQLQEGNHDSLLHEAAQAGMIPCLQMLNEEQKSDLLLGLELGSELNAGQLAQAESVPVNLEFLTTMKGREHAFEMKFLEQILDVAGALGHLDPFSAKNLMEPVFEAFQTVHEVSVKIIARELGYRAGYDEILKKRGRLLSGIGFRRLSVSDKEERALLRLLTMGRTTDVDQAELFSRAFHALDPRHKQWLITGLNIDGKPNETAVLPYYMPAILSEVLKSTKDASEEDRQKALTSLMKYLAKVLDKSSKAEDDELQAQNTGSIPGIVIEHNMMKAREVISSENFLSNPEKLDELEIPQGQQLQRRRTSHSL